MNFLLKEIENKIPWLESKSQTIKAIISDLLLILIFKYFELTYYDMKLFNVKFFILWIFLNYILGKYSDNETFIKFTFIKDLVKSFIALFLTVLILIIFKSYSININVINSLSLIITFVLSTLAGQYLLKNLFKSQNVKNLNWLIFGADEDILQIKEYLKQTHKFIKLKKLEIDKHSPKFIKNKFRGILITDYNHLSKEENETLKKFKSNGINIIQTRDWSEKVLQRVPSELIMESEANTKEFIIRGNNLYLKIKRLSDIFLSLILLIIFLPIIILSGFLIRLNDKGPIFYSQIRTGYYGQKFRLWKLRSMKVNAEINNDAIWASKNDPRITTIGKVIRKC